MLLSNDQALASGEGILKGGAISNDANHLSGPSKTGEELGRAIIQAIEEAGKHPEQVGFVSAHGTATNYNDEMEAKAIHHAGIKAPVNSLNTLFRPYAWRFRLIGNPDQPESDECRDPYSHTSF